MRLSSFSILPFYILLFLTSLSKFVVNLHNSANECGRGDLLETDRDDPSSKETRKHRLGPCSTIKKSKFLQSTKQELISTNFKQLEPKKFNNEINNFFKDNYCNKLWNYVKFMVKSLTEMEELRKFQSSTFDTIARRKLVEDQNTKFKLSGGIQELHDEMNCMIVLKHTPFLVFSVLPSYDSHFGSSHFGSSHFCSNLSLLCGTGVVWFWHFLSVLRRVQMVRKSWTQVEVPGGWLQLFRGPRPKSEQWLMQSGRSPSAAQVPGKPPVRGRWRSGAVHRRREDVSAVKVLEAMAALGPEDGATKAGLEAALRRAKEQHKGVSPGRAPVPEVTFEAARVRVQKLEAALLAIADFPGPEVDVLQAVLTHAKAAAVPPPVNVQVTQCQQFIERTVKRIEELDRVRETESRRLQEGRQRIRLPTVGNEGFRRCPSHSGLPR